MNDPILIEKWRLARLSKQTLIQLALTSVIIGLAFLLFHFQGNTTDVRAFGRSAILWMVERWDDDDGTGDYSHGWLIPFVSAAIVWLKRKELAAAPKSVSYIGLAVVVLALLFHWLGAKAQQTRLSLFGLVLLIWGIPFYFYGWRVAKILIFPCAYLTFCIPLNFLDSVTFPLRIFATIVSTALLNGLGIAAERSGSAIYSAAAGGFSFDVADPCSGIRSLLALTALTAVYAYFTQKTLLKKWLLFLSAIPLAIIGNIARIVVVAIVAEAFGEELALGLFHDYSGYVVFSVAIGLMLGVSALLNMDLREMRERWKQVLLSPTSSSSA
ncbi:MAG: exosortase/archaeosortase family protein [Kiritimatiellae bacterium]|nr:exosortase/archaeosortase family protein [Kiritimatiellia bacterium]MDW8459021.1 exosortase/archaeosortase family protein [Verrucomicrobiota bacterium]